MGGNDSMPPIEPHAIPGNVWWILAFSASIGGRFGRLRPQMVATHAVKSSSPAVRAAGALASTSFLN